MKVPPNVNFKEIAKSKRGLPRESYFLPYNAIRSILIPNHRRVNNFTSSPVFLNSIRKPSPIGMNYFK